MRFADPGFLVLLALPMTYGFRRWRARRRAPAHRLSLPALGFLADLPVAGRGRWRPILPVLHTLGLALLALALARPQMPREVREIRLRSRNIMLALDISSSMKAGDFH